VVVVLAVLRAAHTSSPLSGMVIITHFLVAGLMLMVDTDQEGSSRGAGATTSVRLPVGPPLTTRMLLSSNSSDSAFLSQGSTRVGRHSYTRPGRARQPGVTMTAAMAVLMDEAAAAGAVRARAALALPAREPYSSLGCRELDMLSSRCAPWLPAQGAVL
jgi:hypothetical protein